MQQGEYRPARVNSLKNLRRSVVWFGRTHDQYPVRTLQVIQHVHVADALRMLVHCSLHPMAFGERLDRMAARVGGGAAGADKMETQLAEYQGTLALQGCQRPHQT